jgi:mono/diheme cytochrome c family protein
VLVALFCAALLGACGPDSTTDLLTVVATVPAEAADAPLRVRFDGYLSEAMRLGAAARLASADVGVAVSVLYDPVEQGLVVVPVRPLRVGLGYTLTVDAAVVEGVDGRRLDADLTVDFVAGNPASAGHAPRTPVRFADLEADLRAACGDCHGASPGAYPPLTAADLVEAPSKRRPGAVLVQPGAPLGSELVRRILPDYPGTLGAPMPPDAPLDVALQKRVVDWVRDGALP